MRDEERKRLGGAVLAATRSATLTTRLAEDRIHVLPRPSGFGYGVFVEVDGGYATRRDAERVVPAWHEELRDLVTALRKMNVGES